MDGGSQNKTNFSILLGFTRVGQSGLVLTPGFTYSLTNVLNSLFFVLFDMRLVSEASWLRKKPTTVTSADPTDCTTSTARMPDVNLSLCKQRQVLTPRNKGKTKRQSNTSALPSHLLRFFFFSC